MVTRKRDEGSYLVIRGANPQRVQRFADRFDGALGMRLDREEGVAARALHETKHSQHGRLLVMGWLGRN